jgi:phosphoribosylanthranilate isomerase
MRTRIKICGLTRPQDVDAAVAAGVDAIGFVFYPQSPRAVDAATARALIRRLPAWVAAVGLFVNAPRDQILATADTAGLSHLQLHGDESAEDCAGLGRPVIKALRVKMTHNLDQLAAEKARIASLVAHYSHCQAVLLDSESQGFGGSGQGFDWAVIGPGLTEDPQRQSAWVLSGGLESGSVGGAILKLHPSCVDVSSGVERLDAAKVVKGEKDPQRIEDFVAAVRAADQLKIKKS